MELLYERQLQFIFPLLARLFSSQVTELKILYDGALAI